jgi:hypothetical protein
VSSTLTGRAIFLSHLPETRLHSTLRNRLPLGSPCLSKADATTVTLHLQIQASVNVIGIVLFRLLGFQMNLRKICAPKLLVQLREINGLQLFPKL